MVYSREGTKGRQGGRQGVAGGVQTPLCPSMQVESGCARGGDGLKACE